jgi:GMP synthase (glutamine-hydrolysing)
MMQSAILILDFGSQYTQLLARRVRELEVYCEVWPFDVPPESIKAAAPAGVILSGGPESVYDNTDFRIPEMLFAADIPLLGICYGMQALADQQGGKVAACAAKEFGLAYFTHEDDPLFAGVPAKTSVWMSHGDAVTRLPPGFKTLGASDNTLFAAIRHAVKPWYGLQFHPEVTHSEWGAEMLKNFVINICKAPCNWSASEVLTRINADVAARVGPEEKVLLGLSGGVDSLVLAVLLQRILGSRLHCLFIDTGLLRDQEAVKLTAVFKALHLNVQQVDASALFLKALQGVSEPEAKRRVIGQIFIDVFATEALKIKEITYLAQGTIYSDVIESAQTGTGKAQVIKSHHNVGGLPEHLPFKLLEPLRHLFKDEVRRVGVALAIPEALIMRHPFPGPGLGVRILGEVKPEFVMILQKADAIFLDVLVKRDWYSKCSQAFAVFLPVKSVGVMGDGRKYDYVISLRAVETTDFMTATPVRLPYEVLEEVALRIVNEVPHVSRVTYDISGKPPATIEWE